MAYRKSNATLLGPRGLEHVGEAWYGGTRGEYRYRLDWRFVPQPQRRVLFILLNPSTATEDQLDPTLKRCLTFAQTWRYDAMTICNAFAYRSTDPDALRNVEEPVGPDNDCFLKEAATQTRDVVLGWGNDGALYARSAAIIENLSPLAKLQCLGVTNEGQPKHPLYLKADCRPMPYVQPPLVKRA